MLHSTTNVVLSVKKRDLQFLPTLIASMIRRASGPLDIVVYAEGAAETEFSMPTAKVRIFDPGHLDGFYGSFRYGEFGRLRVIIDCPSWDRCVSLGGDKVIRFDVARLEAVNMRNNLALANSRVGEATFGGVITIHRKEEIPNCYKHLADIPYIGMDGVLDLNAMRSQGFWDRLPQASLTLRSQSSLALIAACDGKVDVLDASLRWDSNAGTGNSELNELLAASDRLESERCSWESLISGFVFKPVIWEFSPPKEDVLAMLKRGWRLVLWGDSPLQMAENDDEFWRNSVSLAGSPNAASFNQKIKDGLRPELVRSNDLSSVGDLITSGIKPPYIAFRGPGSGREIDLLRSWGYRKFAVVDRSRHADGGPLAQGIDYDRNLKKGSLREGEELHACLEN